ncbi:hypothetical protein XENTR_v10005938 [Xenopus tropicalis]|nr:hypothetical protein XENTR_v10005938 [Xenopus tropicalis]
MKLKERILIPVKLYPKFNFVGKILGPQGNTIKRLQEETGAKISVLGKGSMRDKAKEEELRKGGDPKYSHLNMDLHVFIEVFGPPCESYTRMAHAMEEVKKFLVPLTPESFSYQDMMDDICQEQFMELSYLSGAISRGASVSRPVPPSSASRGAPAGRARGAAIQRISLPPPAPETYDEYGYEDSYAEPSYEGYEGYYSQSQGETEYYDYGHGEGPESYESYGQDNWNGSRPSLKVPSSRPLKGGAYREHPYGRF